MLKCTKFDFGWGGTPLRNLQRSPDTLAGFKGPAFKGRGRKDGGKGKEGEKGEDLFLRREERRGDGGNGMGGLALQNLKNLTSAMHRQCVAQTSAHQTRHRHVSRV